VAPPAVPRAWLWRARWRAACLHSYVIWVAVGLVSIVDGPVRATVVAFALGLALLLLLVTTRGPSPTEARAAEALRTGVLPDGMSMAVVDTAAAAVSQARWARFALPLAVVLVVAGTSISLARGASADRHALGAVVSLLSLSWGWATTVSVREGLRWRAGEDERWAARAAGDHAAAG